MTPWQAFMCWMIAIELFVLLVGIPLGSDEE
jgi:hypothetical protein